LVDRAKAKPIVAKLMPVTVIPEIDTTSINAISAKLALLQLDYNKAQTDSDRKSIALKIKAEEAKLKAIEKASGDAIVIEEDFYNKIQTLSRQGLIAEKKKLKASLKLVKESLGEQSKEYKALQDKIEKINEVVGQGVADVANQFASAFSDLGDLFSKFGDEDTAKLLGQLSGVASGIGKIASGDIVGGAFEILNSAITVEIDSNTEKFEKDIERIGIILNRLSRDISDAFGMDKIDARLAALTEEANLLKANRGALQAELEARKVTKVLGVTVAKKGKGSGTDEEAVKKFEDAIDELEHKLKNLQIEIFETLTATTRDSITDSIIEGFKNGKSSIADFASTFEDLMKNAIIESFKLKYLEGASNAFFEQFGEMAQSGDGLSAIEIESLRISFASLIEDSGEKMKALNDILGQSGIDGGMFGGSAQGNLQSEISRSITEETGTELAGLMRRIAEDVRSGLLNGRTAVENLIKIERNTFETVNELRLSVIELKNISKNTRDSYLNDLGV